MLYFPFFAGTLSSMVHVVSGPDHLAAVTPLVIETKKKAWKIGLSWGLGHLAGMLSIGVLFTIFKELIPVDAISAYSEQIVGLVLIVIGFWAFYKIFQKEELHEHPHIHVEKDPLIHVHQHAHHDTNAHSHLHKNQQKQHELASFSIGFLHGLAGIAHFILFLPVLSFESQWDVVNYLVGFAAGTVLSMTMYALVLNNLTKFSKQEHNPTFFKGIRLAGGMFAVVIGFYWMFFI
ncbi:MAG: sulfite exporter TauE/SafE family protein [Flavobacteriaceae bacterium]|nr:sulfite exporter TauE/SafE family protein [Flavobacteriaceae bacterium]